MKLRAGAAGAADAAAPAKVRQMRAEFEDDEWLTECQEGVQGSDPGRCPRKVYSSRWRNERAAARSVYIYILRMSVYEGKICQCVRLVCR